MADIPQVISTDPAEMLGMGRRHLAVKDYSSATTCLGKACELLADKHGQQADECGEAYFWYGKALLGLAREESGVLGDGIPGGEENQEDEEEEDEGGEEDNADETDKNITDNKTEETENNENSNIENKDEEVEESTEEKKIDDQPGSSDMAEPGCSSGATSSAVQDGEPVDNEEDDVENLQVAWEVFELARDIFLKRGENGKKELADVYLHLGEVSLESEMYDKAVVDMSKSLDLFKELYSADDRRIAETHYQIGLAHSLSNGFDDAIVHFKNAAEILEFRIKNLQSPSAATDNADVKKNLTDPFYSIEGEIKELTDLLPEIREKIQDMIDYKAEAIKSVRETLGLETNGQSSRENGCGSSTNDNKKATDISHLIKRKRKPDDDIAAEECSAPKKPTV